MKKLLLLSLFGITLFYACEKDPLYEDFQREDLIRQIGSSEIDMQVITYYNTGYVFEHLTRFSYRKFLYNKNNQLTKIEITLTYNPLSCAIIPGTGLEEGEDPREADPGQYIEFDYSGNGRMEKRRFYFIHDKVAQLQYYETFEYENDRVSRINWYNPQNQMTQYYSYAYDENGNVQAEDYYYVQEGTEAILQSRKLSEFDTMHNPFIVFRVEGTPGYSTNTNNITQQTFVNYYDGQEDSYTQENSYEYNKLGYPSRVNNLDYIYGEGAK